MTNQQQPSTRWIAKWVVIVSILMVCVDRRALCVEPGSEHTTPSVDALYLLCISGNVFELDKELPKFTHNESERLFFEGQLDAAFLSNDHAKEKLERFIRLNSAESKYCHQAWLTLGKIYERCGEYERAAQAFKKALEPPQSGLAKTDLLIGENGFEFNQTLAGVPAQSCDAATDNFSVNTTRSSKIAEYGRVIFIDARVNNYAEQSLFDTGTNSNVVTESFARRHRLRMLEGRAHLTSPGDKTVSSRVGIADEVAIGKMVYHHVVFNVVEDKELGDLHTLSAVDVVIGTPLILPLKHLRIIDENSDLQVMLRSDPASTKNSVRPTLAFLGLIPIVQVGCRGKMLPFILDLGAIYTSLLTSFARISPDVFSAASPTVFLRSGFGGVAAISMTMASPIELVIGDTKIQLPHVTTYNDQPFDIPPLYGLLGLDVIGNGFDLDFDNLRFTVYK